MNNNYINIILFFISGILSIWLGFFCFDKSVLVGLYTKGIYYFLSFSIFVWVLAVFKAVKITSLKIILEKIHNFCNYHQIAIFISFLLIVLGALVCPPEYRILADETNLLSDSMALYEAKECYITISAIGNDYVGKTLLDCTVDKRPALFPLLLCFMHNLFGYRAENIFILNSVIGFLTLFLFYYLIQLKFKRFWGICGILLLSSYPLFLMYTNCGGFELFNLFCSLILFLLAYNFLKTPTAEFAEILLLWVPLIGQSRYESVMSIIVVMPLIFYYLPKLEYFRFSYKVWLFPLLFLPVAWLRAITNDKVSWQLDNLEDGFGLGCLLKNSQKAFNFFFIETNEYGIISVISFISFIGFFLFARKIIKNKKNKMENALFYFSVSFFIIHAVIKFLYSWTDLTNPIISRQGILFLPFFVFFTLFCFFYLHKKHGVKKIYFITFSLSFLISYWPNASVNYGIKDMPIFWRLKKTCSYLNEHAPDIEKYILITNNANLYVPLEYSAVSYKEYFKYKDIVDESFKNYNFQYFILLQEIDVKTNAPFEMNNISFDNYSINHLCDINYYKDCMLRVSKCVPNYHK